MEVLLRKDGKLLVGDYDSECPKPEVYMQTIGTDYVSRSNVYLIIWQGVEYLYPGSCDGLIKLDKSCFNKMEYVGNLDINDYSYFIYKFDQFVIAISYDLGKIKTYSFYCRDGIECYVEYMYIDTETDKYIILPQRYSSYIFVVDKETKEVIKFDTDRVSCERVREAVQCNMVSELQMLYKLERTYLGKYNLSKLLLDKHIKVSLEKMVKILKNDMVNESLVAGESIPILNLRRAMKYMDSVNPVQGFDVFEVHFDSSSEKVSIVHCMDKRNHIVYEFGCKAVMDAQCGDLNENKIIALCKQYSLCRQLDEDGLAQWAILLKSVKKIHKMR